MRISIFDAEAAHHDRFHEALEGHDVHVHTHSIDQPTESEAIALFITSQLDASLISQMPNLRAVATMSTGYDHIDLAACAERDITVMNVPTYGSSTVAEHAFLLILALARKFRAQIARTHGEGRFDTDASLRGNDLDGKTLGLVGLGKIGEHVAQIAGGFGMHVIAFDVQTNDELAQRLGFRYAPLETVLEESDVISLHVPLNDHTRGMIDHDAFNRMKPGALLINTARGGVIDSAALLSALKTNRIGGAALDVLSQEHDLTDDLAALSRSDEDLRALLIDHQLLRHPRVIITPHNAFNSHEAIGRIIDTTVENLRSWIDGSPQNVIK